jgi:hypothetical protein
VRIEFVNRWTVNDPGECGFTGSGTVTVRGHTARATPVAPIIDPFTHEWRVQVPYGYKGSLRTEMHLVAAAGTISREDNTTQAPPEELPSCPPAKTGCGTVAFKKPKTRVHGYDRRHLAVDLRSSAFTSSKCLAGRARSWSDTSYVGNRANGEVLVKMPSQSALRRRVLRVTGSAHKSTTGLDDNGGTATDDITRKVTVTFKRR